MLWPKNIFSLCQRPLCHVLWCGGCCLFGQVLGSSDRAAARVGGGVVGGFGACGVILFLFDGEFDPGSGRTLAACLTHASRTERLQLAGVLEWRTGE